jgi:GAF domain-containing protein
MSESKKAIDALKALSLQAAVPTDTLATALAELSGLAATAAQLEAVSLSSALRSDDLIDNFAEATKRQHDELLRAALGPFEDLKNRLLIEARLVPQIDMSAFIERLINNAMLMAKKGAARIALHSRAAFVARRSPCASC